MINEGPTKITKTLTELLDEVFQGNYKEALEGGYTHLLEENYTDFRKWLAQEEMITLDLTGQVKKGDLRLLAIALQTTNVQEIILANNDLSGDTIYNFVSLLPGTKIAIIDFSGNNCGYWSYDRLVNLIPNTNIVKLKTHYQGQISAQLTNVLASNQKKRAFSPYVFAQLRQIPQEQQKASFLNLEKINKNSTTIDQLEFGGGIVMQLPRDLSNLFINWAYPPVKSPNSGTRLKSFSQFINKKYPNGIKVDFNKVDKHGETPLYSAVKNNQIEMVKKLLEKPEIIVNLGNIYNNTTPFLCAIQTENYKIAEVLLNDARVNPFRADAKGFSIFNYFDKEKKNFFNLQPIQVLVEKILLKKNDNYKIVEASWGGYVKDKDKPELEKIRNFFIYFDDQYCKLADSCNKKYLTLLEIEHPEKLTPANLKKFKCEMELLKIQWSAIEKLKIDFLKIIESKIDNKSASKNI